MLPERVAMEKDPHKQAP